MAFSIIDHASGINTDHNTATSATLNSTGATVAFAEVQFQGISGAVSLSDSKSNTPWTKVAHSDDGSGRSIELWYCNLTSVGSGHTASVTGTGTFPSINWLVCSGGFATLDQTNTNFSASASTLNTGSVTPTTDNQILIAGGRVSGGGNSVNSIDSSFTLVSTNANDANNVASGIAALIETAATTKNPTFTFNSADVAVTAIATFKLPSTSSMFLVL